ncbi:hypothetical protein OL548_00050 [Lysinibacillus sp. MHQ-1]|nr:hypothetical protein OL548_00050 [Lysinibacillus sp. MHQ-1]
MSNIPMTLEQLTLETADAVKQQLREHEEVQQIAHQIDIKKSARANRVGKRTSYQIIKICRSSSSYSDPISYF